MSKTTREYLEDMQKYADYVAEFTALGKAEFDSNLMNQFAVARAYEVIGEIAKRLPNELLMTQSQAEWKQIIGMRDYISHNYYKVDTELLWIAVEKLPILQKAIQALLDGLGDEE